MDATLKITLVLAGFVFAHAIPPPNKVCRYKGKWYPEGLMVKEKCFLVYCAGGAPHSVMRPRCVTTEEPKPPTRSPIGSPSSKVPTEFPTTMPMKPRGVTTEEPKPPTRSPSSKVPTEFPTTMPIGCFYNGQVYAPGATIAKGPCPIVCTQYGQVVHGDTWECIFGRTTTTTTSPRPTHIPGCSFNGRFYAPGTTISKGLCPVVCDQRGQVRYIDTWECIFGKTTPPPTTIPPLETTIPKGCMYKGKMYQAGSTIEPGPCPTVCDQWGRVMFRLDTDECLGITPSSALPPTTDLQTTPPSRKKWCRYHGRWYPQGLMEKTKCFFVYCANGAPHSVMRPACAPGWSTTRATTMRV